MISPSTSASAAGRTPKGSAFFSKPVDKRRPGFRGDLMRIVNSVHLVCLDACLHRPSLFLVQLDGTTLFRWVASTPRRKHGHWDLFDGHTGLSAHRYPRCAEKCRTTPRPLRAGRRTRNVGEKRERDRQQLMLHSGRASPCSAIRRDASIALG